MGDISGIDPPDEVTQDASTSSPTPGGRFSRKILEIGFLTGLLLALACFGLSSYYLISFEQHANAAVTKALADSSGNLSAHQIFATQFALGVHMYVAKVLLLSCGVFAGLSFGFLGFSLFLIGVEGAVDAQLETPSALRLSVVKLAPGAFVIVCAAILIGVCATGVAPTRIDAQNQATMPQTPAMDMEQDDADRAASNATDAVDPRAPDTVGGE